MTEIERLTMERDEARALLDAARRRVAILLDEADATDAKLEDVLGECGQLKVEVARLLRAFKERSK